MRLPIGGKMDGKEKAKLALADAGAFNFTMHKYGVGARILARNVEELKGNCKVFPGIACVYKITISGAANFASVMKYEQEIRAAIAGKRKELGLFDKQMSIRFDAEPFLTLEVDAPPAILEYEELEGGALQAAIGYGCNFDGKFVKIFDLNKEHQTLVAALSGHGKSVLLKNIIMGLLANSDPSQLALYGIDFKNSDLLPYKKMPHTEGYAYKEDDAAVIIERFTIEVQRRISNQKARKKMLLVIDEGAELDESHDDALASIMKMGRSLGIHVLMATQHPTAAQIGKKTARSFTHRIVGRVDSQSSAFWATGVADSGANLLRQHGAFLYVYGGQIERFQSFYLSSEKEAELIEKIKGRKKK